MVGITGGVTFTLDLEDHRPSDDVAERFPAITRRVLDFLDERTVRGTFFVVGEVADRHPALVREVAERGHELGLHGWDHTPLTELDDRQLRDGATRGKELLEQVGGRPVRGFRAPTFSLVRSSRWAMDVLADVGFTYSSSVLPARNPRFGDPTLPITPFCWPSGVVELPCPVGRVGTIGLPYLGGVYLRALPHFLSRAAGNAFGHDVFLWLYCHPYDFDPDEPYWVVPGLGHLGSRLLWYNRRSMFSKVDAALRGRVAPPLGERVAALEPLPAPLLP